MLRQPLIFVHLLGAFAWIGGMFFAYACLRPAAAEVLEPPRRLPLWSATLGRFLRYMSFAVALVLASGLALLGTAGWRDAPAGWLIMLGLGLAMAAVFVYIRAALYPKLRAHCSASAWPAAAQELDGIRRLVVLNLVLGICTVAAAVSAR
jgi:uncharacterized membrane protein